MASIKYGWAYTEQNELSGQLVNIGTKLPEEYGVTADKIAYWRYGAAVNQWLQMQANPAAHDLSMGLNGSRDELQLDKTVEVWQEPTFVMPPSPTAPADIVLMTNFVSWCNDLFRAMQRAGLSDANAKLIGFLVPDPQAVSDNDLQARVVSIDTLPGGKIVVTTTRDHQTMVHCEVTLDTGEVMNKTLATTKFTFMLPTDRVHAFTARAIYADGQGEDMGQWSEVRSETSEL